jgi:hypothetical protein
MSPISTLNTSGAKTAILYKYKGDGGLSVAYSHGRMDWYRTDTREYINIDNYSYWE